MAKHGEHRTHLVWDWNGTLLDDIHAVVGATNTAFAEVGLAPITLEQYRATYCVPIPLFYQRLLGRIPDDAEWQRMDVVFHDAYAELRAGFASSPTAPPSCSRGGDRTAAASPC